MQDDLQRCGLIRHCRSCPRSSPRGCSGGRSGQLRCSDGGWPDAWRESAKQQCTPRRERVCVCVCEGGRERESVCVCVREGGRERERGREREATAGTLGVHAASPPRPIDGPDDLACGATAHKPGKWTPTGETRRGLCMDGRDGGMGRMGMEGGGRAGDCREASTNSKAVSICASRPTFFCCSCGRGDRGGGARIVVVVVVVVIVVVVVAVVVGGQAKSFAGSYLPPQPFVSSRLASQRGGDLVPPRRSTFDTPVRPCHLPPQARARVRARAAQRRARQGKARQRSTASDRRPVAPAPSVRTCAGGGAARTGS